MKLEKILADIAKRNASADSRLLPTPSTRREPSASETQATYQPPNYGLLFCPHSKSYFEPCSACRRTAKQARQQFYAFEKRYGLK